MKSNKFIFIAHIPKIIKFQYLSYSSFINPDYIHTPSLITILYNPAETTGIFAFHHFLQPFHPHSHSILPPLSALIQQASAHISQQGTAVASPQTSKESYSSLYHSDINNHIEYPHKTTIHLRESWIII